MADLKCKTRSNSRVQGKPRVYFCCHPMDFDVYFESISNEILAKQNCVIWYLDKAAERDKDYMNDLSQMQLFVMPVTSNLLKTENDALNIDFRFAVDNHIPVLPLMQETGLETLFNQKCGDLQFLDKFTDDKTVVSYDKKLTDFLSSVLIGDETAEKIRSAFSAYVFLSYRKKDRIYAQELMRLIHMNEFCRDVAIWYDEFLTPGENFNNEIREALEKSRLFAMVVTPNLVNEKNYVMSIEYPMAKQNNMPVLPVEMVQTDRNALRSCFEGISDITDVGDALALTGQLQNVFGNIVKTENDNVYEHNYYIGLAYLGGVDVEVDNTKALELITGSAQKGLMQAVEKLASMYVTGNGVNIDIETALVWKRELVRLKKENYIKSQKAADCNEWLQAWFDLGVYLQIAGKFDEAIKEQEQIYKYCSEQLVLLKKSNDVNGVVDEFYEFIYMNISVITLATIGEIYTATGNLEKSKAYAEKSLAISKELCTRWDDNVWCFRQASTISRNLGFAYALEMNFEKAKEYYLVAVEHKERLAQNEEEMFRVDLANLYTDISNIYKVQKNIDEALKYQSKSVNIAKVLAEQLNTESYKKYYIKHYLEFADLHRAKGDVDSCMMMCADALKLIEEVEAQSEEKQNWSKGYCLLILAQAHLLIQSLEKAKGYACQSIDLLEQYVSDAGVLVANNNLVVAYVVYIHLLLLTNDVREIQCYEERATIIIEEVLQAGINIQFFECVAFYTQLADFYSGRNQIAKAKSLYKKAEALIDKGIYNPDDKMMLIPYVQVYANLGDIYLSEDNKEKAEEYLLKSASLIVELRRACPDKMVGLYPYFFYYNVAVFNDEKYPSKAQKYYLMAIECIEAIPEKDRTLESYDILCMSYYSMFDMSPILKRGRWKKSWQKAIGDMQRKFGNECLNTTSGKAFLS